jgi:hypothetical protein
MEERFIYLFLGGLRKEIKGEEGREGGRKGGREGGKSVVDCSLND